MCTDGFSYEYQCRETTITPKFYYLIKIDQSTIVLFIIYDKYNEYLANYFKLWSDLAVVTFINLMSWSVTT